MPELTFIIPSAVYHRDLVNRAVESVRNQTIPCDYIVVEDDDSRGAGWARNRGLERIDSPFISWLDADDEIEPDFAEQCFRIWIAVNRANKYVYTNWFEGDSVKQAPAPCDLWRNQTYHLVTSFIPTEYVRRIGGFDEMLTGAEDTDFGIRLKLSGICGIHLNMPLVHYNIGGLRSQTARKDGGETQARAYMSARYGDMTMGCCGGDNPIPNTPSNEPQPGDILVQALWTGNRQERGRHTGRLYPRASYPKILYVAPEDAIKSPELWAKVTSAEAVRDGGQVLLPRYQTGEVKPQSGNWTRAADAIFGGGRAPVNGQAAPMVSPTTAETVNHYKPMINERGKADVLKAAQERVRK